MDLWFGLQCGELLNMLIMGINPGVAGKAARRGGGCGRACWRSGRRTMCAGGARLHQMGLQMCPGRALGRGGSTIAPFPPLRPLRCLQARPLSSSPGGGHRTRPTGASECLGQWERWAERRRDVFTAQTGKSGHKDVEVGTPGPSSLVTRSKTQGWSLGSWSGGSRG